MSRRILKEDIVLEFEVVLFECNFSRLMSVFYNKLSPRLHFFSYYVSCIRHIKVNLL